MATSAKGGFPGCPKRKIEKRKVKSSLYHVGRKRLSSTLSICEQLKKNIQRFYEIFGDSDEDDEFLGFSSEECGLRAYKRIGSVEMRIPDILCSPIDLNKKKVTTRLAHARKSLEALPSSQRTRRRKQTIIRKKYSNSKVPIVDGNTKPTQPLVRIASVSEQRGSTLEQGFTKYKNSGLDFHRLSKGGGFESRSTLQESDHLPGVLKPHTGKPLKTSPIKPATFIAPSLTKQPQNVTNITPTCLKIKLNVKDSDKDTGPGHPKVLAKALLARANKRCRRGKNWEMDPPMHTSTPISAAASKTKSKLFTMPIKSSRSSRIIKVNRKYIENYSETSSGITQLETASTSPPTDPTTFAEQTTVSQVTAEPCESPSKGRPLLKEATFRVAALANINNKPPPSRIVTRDKGLSNRMRARKLIKRARFKHPTSSSTLVVGNDFEDEIEKKKNLIREATFKAPNQSAHSANSDFAKDALSDLGLSKQQWDRLMRHDSYRNGEPCKPWTKQEIHNVLHGANTFSNSWASVARQYDYHYSHRDWSSVRNKAKALQSLGLLSESLKVKSSILLQLRPRYSDNPNVMVFTPNELRMRGLVRNIECDIGKGGRMKAYSIGDNRKAVCEKSRVGMKKHHKKLFENWKRLSERHPPDDRSMLLGFSRENFHRMCRPKSGKIKTWTPREIHNVLHGIYVFGIGEWTKIWEMYLFDPTHDNIGIRARSKSAFCKGLVDGGKVKPEIIPLLRPKFSPLGREYFEFSERPSRGPGRVIKQRKSSDDNGETPGQGKPRKVDGKKQDTASDNDMTSPPRKQTFHLFGTAPVWDDSGSGPGMHEIEESLVPEALDKVSDNSLVDSHTHAGDKTSPSRERKTSSDSLTSRKEKKLDEVEGVVSKSSGPRIKHVCRRASLVTGQRVATYEEGKNPRLSALPKEERERIASEAEKLRGLKSDQSCSSDSDAEAPQSTPRKQLPGNSRRERVRSGQTLTRKRGGDVTVERRCKSCQSCLIAECGDCDNCRNPAITTNRCLRRPACLVPMNGSEGRGKEDDRKMADKNKGKDPGIQEIQDQAAQRLNNNSDTAAQYQEQQQAAGRAVVLSPESKYRLRKELHERDLKLPAVVKMDEWKERYEVDDLWKMGGVSLFTSMTPSTQFLCFLCGSVGKSRPARRISSNSDSSTCSEHSEVMSVSPLFIFCSSCCEPFHPFCLDDHEQQSAINEAKKGFWICRRCRFCNVCGRPENLLECRRCNKTYHSACLGPRYPNKPSKNRVWVCMRCVRCRSCGASRPGRRPGSKWTHDFQLCQRCGDLFDKGNFCPICKRCYRDEDYDSRMVQCGTCKRWVHSRCESLSIEMYTLLSHLPDDVQYVCPDCDGRQGKVENEFLHTDTAFTDDAGNDSIKGDKMRELLCKLPPPPWKKLIEKEIQSGIENVTMALFHSKEASCILKKTSDIDSDRPSDLFSVRFAVHNRRYTSVGEFSLDVCAILDTVPDSADQSQEPDPGDKRSKRRKINLGPRSVFCQEMHNVFPWFDVKTGRVRDSSDVPEDLLPNATLPPHTDHMYAHWQDRDINMVPGGPDTPMKNLGDETLAQRDDYGLVKWDSEASKISFEDRRQCLFCAKYGDDAAISAGRLLYCGQDEWVHVNCALWSAEVFERHDGSLQNVHSAVSRGKMMKCEYCKLPGATVGCNTRDCPQNYHFSCARAANCCFQEDKKVFCARHVRHVHRELITSGGFEVARRVVVDNDEMRLNKRWQRGVNAHDVTILMGSAVIHQLGQLAMSSDSRNYLIPVHYRMTRIFWSTAHAGRRVRYTITVTEHKPSVDSDTSLGGFGSPTEVRLDQHRNHTIAHVDEDKPVFGSPTKKPRIPGADSCRSKLLERFEPSPLPPPISRRKSWDHSSHEVMSHRSRRMSGPSYTVIGDINRTLPQSVTPLPRVTESLGQHSRLISAKSGPEDGENVADLESKYEPNVCEEMEKESCGDEAVKISPDNPFLNLRVEGVQLSTNAPAVTTSADTTYISGRPSSTSESSTLPYTNHMPVFSNSITSTTTCFLSSVSSSSSTVIPSQPTTNPGSSGTIMSTLSPTHTPIVLREPSNVPVSALEPKQDACSIAPTLDTITPTFTSSPNAPVESFFGSNPTSRQEDEKVLKKQSEISDLSVNKDLVYNKTSEDEDSAENHDAIVSARCNSKDSIPDEKEKDSCAENPKKSAESETAAVPFVSAKDEGKLDPEKSNKEAKQDCEPDRDDLFEVKGDLDTGKPSAENREKTSTGCDDKSILLHENALPDIQKKLAQVANPVALGSSNSESSFTINLLKEAREAEKTESEERATDSENANETASLWWKKNYSRRQRSRKRKITDLYPVSSSRLAFRCVKPKKKVKLDSSSEDIDYFPVVTGAEHSNEELQNCVSTRSKKKRSESLNGIEGAATGISNEEQDVGEGLDEEDDKICVIKTRSKRRIEANTSTRSSSKDSTEEASSDHCENSGKSVIPDSSSSAELLDSSQSSQASVSSTDSSSSMKLKTKKGRGRPMKMSKNLRNFARESNDSGTEPQELSSQNVGCLNEKGSSDNDVFKSPQNVLKKTRSRSLDPAKEKTDSENSGGSTSSLRKRSRSVEVGQKVTNKSRIVMSLKNDLKCLETDFSPRRYPRRNTLTCLKSFSGLSPTYAIQSYTAMNHSRRERAAARSFKIANSVQSKPKSKATSGSKNVSKIAEGSRNVDESKAMSETNVQIGKDESRLREEKAVELEKKICEKGSQDEETDAHSENECVKPVVPEGAENVIPCSIVLSSCIGETGPQLVGLSEQRLTSTPEKTESGHDEDALVVRKRDNPKMNLRNSEEASMQKGGSQENAHGLCNGHISEISPDDVSDGSEKPNEENVAGDASIGAASVITHEQESGSISDENGKDPTVVTDDHPKPSLFESACDPENENTQDALNGQGMVSDSEVSIELPRGIDDEVTQSQKSNLLVGEGIQLMPLKENPEKEDKGDSRSPVPNPSILLPDTDFSFSNDVIVPPLSPRDEPKLPLPIDTDADTAPFMVTSECPVLNADEVQSLLSMPPATTVCSTFSQPFSTNATAPPQPLRQEVLSSSHTPQTPVNYNPLSYPQTIQSSVTYLPVNYQQVPVVIYNQPIIQTYITNPGNLATVVGSPDVSVHASYCLPMSTDPAKFSSAPNILTQISTNRNYIHHGNPVKTTNLTQQGFAVPMSTTRQKNPPVTSLTHQSAITCHPVPALSMQTQTPKIVNAANPTPPHAKMQLVQNQDQQHHSGSAGNENADTDLKLASDQKLVLEQMIEFYSNKNNLSSEEKAMVRAIIAQQIKNKSLPMPSLDCQQGSSPHLGNNKTNAQKRPHEPCQESPLGGPAKRLKRMRRKDRHTHKHSYSPEKNMPPSDDEGFSSPLFNVYLGAIHAEHTNDEKIAKKWREVVRNINRHSVYLDVPWSSKRGNKENRLPPPPPQSSKRPHLMFEIRSEDGYYAKGPDLQELVTALLDGVTDCQSNSRLPPSSPCLTSVLTPHAFLGVSHDAVRFLVEQLPGARHCPRYRAKYHKHREMPEEVVTHINPHGCARAERYQGRSKPDMFSFLASKHRVPPSYDPARSQNVDMQQNSTRRATSMDLPMAMRFRHLRTFAREAVGVYRSAIHGRGLYCKRDIEAGEMVMEYTGEVIRCFLTDHREKMYEKRGIGCYMFRMDDMYVVDATMMGSGARFINHSCEPSCYSRIVHIDGKKHIIIFALRKIFRGEELTYDYKFPIEAEDQKIMCNCGAKTCRKYMN